MSANACRQFAQDLPCILKSTHVNYCYTANTMYNMQMYLASCTSLDNM